MDLFPLCSSGPGWSYFPYHFLGWHGPVFPYVLMAGMVLFSVCSHGWHGPVFPYVLKSDMILSSPTFSGLAVPLGERLHWLRDDAADMCPLPGLRTPHHRRHRLRRAPILGHDT